MDQDFWGKERIIGDVLANKWMERKLRLKVENEKFLASIKIKNGQRVSSDILLKLSYRQLAQLAVYAPEIVKK